MHSITFKDLPKKKKNKLIHITDAKNIDPYIAFDSFKILFNDKYGRCIYIFITVYYIVINGIFFMFSKNQNKI